MKLHERLKAIRRQRDLTLVQVAEAAHIAPSFLSNLERGKANPTITTLARLAASYHMNVADLLAGVGNEELMAGDSSPSSSDTPVQGEITNNASNALTHIQLLGNRPESEDQRGELIRTFLSSLVGEPLIDRFIAAYLEAKRKDELDNRREGELGRAIGAADEGEKEEIASEA